MTGVYYMHSQHDFLTGCHVVTGAAERELLCRLYQYASGLYQYASGTCLFEVFVASAKAGADDSKTLRAAVTAAAVANRGKAWLAWTLTSSADMFEMPKLLVTAGVGMWYGDARTL